MNRKTTVALVLFLALGAAAYLVLRQPPKGQRTAQRPRPLPALKGQAFDRVAIAEPGKPLVELVRRGAAWALSKPLGAPADGYASRTLVEKLEGLEVGDLVSEQKSSHAEHEVDEAHGVRVTVAQGAKTLADFWLGKTVAEHTLLRPAGRDQVYQAVGALRPALVKELKLWRDRTIFSFKPEDARALRVVTAAGEIALSRADDKAPWKIERSSVPVPQLDAEVPRSLVSSLASLSAADFADGMTLAQAGLESPSATIAVQLADKTEQRLLVGKSLNDEHWVKRGDAPQLFTIKRYSAETLLQRPVDFRDKTILSFKPEELQQLRIAHVKGRQRTQALLTRQGAAWHKDGKPLGDQTKASAAVQALATLAADRIARHSPEELGMAQPEWQLELRLKDGTRHALSVGGKDQDGFFGVQRKGAAELFACRKYKLDQFLLEPATL